MYLLGDGMSFFFFFARNVCDDSINCVQPQFIYSLLYVYALSRVLLS